MNEYKFEEEEEEEEEESSEKAPEAPTTIKVGEKEYSQDELDELVKLGSTAKEYEEKWNRPIGDFYPDYTQKSQKLSEYEKAEKARAEAEVAKKQEQGIELSPEEKREAVLKEARGYGILTKEDLDTEVNSRVANMLRGQELLKQTEGVVKQATTDGKPVIKTDELLAYMDQTGIKNPQTAYEVKFLKELNALEAAKVNGIKQPGLDTSSESNAGGKQPEGRQSVVGRDALAEAIKARLNQTRGAQ